MPKMKHPDSRKQITVAPDAVAMYASQGWTEVAATTTPTKRAARKTTATTKGAAK